MNDLSSARSAFGLATLLFGAISIAWHESDLWAHALKIGGPLALELVWGCGLLLCAGAVFLLFGRGDLGSVLLATGGLLLALSCIVNIAAAPASYPSYIDFFELFAIVCGALAVNSLFSPEPRRAERLMFAARVAFGYCNVSYAAAQLVYFAYTASLIPVWIPGAPFWTALTTLAFALAAVAMLTGRQASLALRLVAMMVALFALLVWVPRLVTAPTFLNWSEFTLTCVIAAAAWVLAVVPHAREHRHELSIY